VPVCCVQATADLGLQTWDCTKSALNAALKEYTAACKQLRAF